ncbi:hypothetical protein ACNKHK_17605 [Shigella flexneri]
MVTRVFCRPLFIFRYQQRGDPAFTSTQLALLRQTVVCNNLIKLAGMVNASHVATWPYFVASQTKIRCRLALAIAVSP